jgi:Domain of unknown function (DUF4440)
MAEENGLLARLIELENQRAEGWLKRDLEILAGLMDEDFIEINYFGRLTRTQILEELFPTLKLEKFDMEDFKLLASDDSLAILSYKVDEELTYKGNKVSGIFHVTAVYRYKNYKWALLIWQITPFMENGKT